MTFGPITLVASVLVIVGILIGWRLSQWRLEVRARRQAAAQRSLSRQLLELRAARRYNYSDLSKLGHPASEFQRRAA
jgi:predicted negative regulator of RcsB-dependent stress response